MVPLGNSSKNLQIKATFQGGSGESNSSNCSLLVHERKAYSLILTSVGDTLECKLVRWRHGCRMDDGFYTNHSLEGKKCGHLCFGVQAEDFLKKNKTGIPLLR